MNEFERDELQMLAELLPSVASSLRSPLDSLHLAAQGLIAKTGVNSPEAAILRQSCFKMLRLVNNMSLAPILTDDLPFYLTDADLTALMTKMYQQCSALAEMSGIRLNLHCKEEFLPSAIHRDYLERALWNLISNAFKFTPKGGEKCHRTFADHGGCGPDPAPLMEELARRGWSPTIVCESAGTQAEDALTMKKMYQAYREQVHP